MSNVNMTNNSFDVHPRDLSSGGIHIATSPRTGSTYLWWLLHTSFGSNVYKTHILNESPENSVSNLPRRYYWKVGRIFFKEEDYIINVLRDPIDTICSMLIQEYVYLEEDIDLEKYINDNVANRIEGYNFFHSNVPKLCDLILNYEDINLHKHEIVNHVSEATGRKIINTEYKDFIKDDKNSHFLKSAKIFDQYDFAKEQVSKGNFIASYSIYNKLIKECKKF